MINDIRKIEQAQANSLMMHVKILEKQEHSTFKQYKERNYKGQNRNQ